MNNTIYDTPEETPGYKGLHGEVVTMDTYRLKHLKFIPDVIIDIGANIGVFTRFARELFPDALIVAVEPDPTNFEHLVKFGNVPETQSEYRHWDYKVKLLNKAIGIGQIWHAKTAANGSGECYLSEGLGYPSELMPLDDRLELSEVETIMPYELIKNYVKNGQKFLIKIDCEGAENSIFTHHPSWEAIKKADAIVMEVHKYASTGGQQQEVNKVTDDSLQSLEATHTCEYDHPHFWAYKK